MKYQSIEEMTGLITSDPEAAEYILHQISDEGPKHKQEISSLLISRILELVKRTEQATGAAFELQDGFEFTTGKDHPSVLPVLMPVVVEHGKDPQTVADAIAQAPEHELVAFSICLQGLEWIISQK